jgi:hypothetical protein
MPTIICNVAALAVATLFYYWRAYYGFLLTRERTLRERVAYMLWVMATMGTGDDQPAQDCGLTAAQS